MRGNTNLVFFSLVRGGHMSQILDHLLGVLCLTRTRFSSMRQTERNYRGKDLETDGLKTKCRDRQELI